MKNIKKIIRKNCNYTKLYLAYPNFIFNSFELKIKLKF